jgi:hypothetical protein
MAAGVSHLGSRAVVKACETPRVVDGAATRGLALITALATALALPLAAALGLALWPRAARADDPEPRAEVPAPQEAPPTGLAHEAVTSGRRGGSIIVTVGVQNALVFDKLVLAYRPENEPEFHGREMRLGPEGTYRAEIPPSGTRGRSVAYYIEALDKDGAPVAGRASAESPLVIQLVGEPPRLSVTDAESHAVDVEEGNAPPPRRYFVALLVGSGAGWATGNGDTNADTMFRPAAFTLAALGQLAPEIGYWVTPTLMLSLQGRFQAVTGTNDVYAADGRVFHTASYAAAGFFKATWLARRPGGAHPFFSLAAGVGQIRHVVTFDSLKACGPTGQEVCVDTIATGPVAVGPGAGIMVDLGAHLVGILELDTQLTFPAYSINLDGELGLGVRF